MPFMDFLRDWFVLPNFDDDDDNRIARVLHISSHVFFVSGIVFLLIATAANNGTAIVLTALATGLGPILHMLIRRNMIKHASLLFSTTLFITFCVALLQSNIKGGFWEYDVVFVGFILPVLVAGFLSGGQVAFTFAILASLIGFGILINQLQLIDMVNINLQLGTPSLRANIILSRTAEALLFLFTAGMVSYMKRALSTSLKTARQSERMLAQRNIQLQNEIAERELAEAQVRELSLEKGRVDALSAFISNVSHDLKTPLSIINTNAYLLGRLEDPHKRQEKIEAIKNQSNRLDRSIQDMLIMAQLDNVMELELQKLDITMLLTQIAARFQQAAKQKQIALWLMAEESIFIRSNSIEMERALSAIVENAINYTPEGGHIIIEIHIETQIINQNVVIKIIDDGIGIHADDLPHIFDRLYRADKARSINSGGTGLGLPIAEKIIHLHHGHISVESQPGNGTVFCIRLPQLETDWKTQSLPMHEKQSALM